MNPKIVLNEQSRIPGIGIRGHRCVLRQPRGLSDKKIRKRVIGRARIAKREYAVVVEQGLLNILIERQLAADLDRVSALVPTEHIAYRVEVRTRSRTADRIRQGELSGDCYLRKRRSSLRREGGTQIGE